MGKRSSLTPAEAYGFATVCVAVATLIRWGLGLLSSDVLPLPTFYPAVLFATLLGGPGPGVFAAILGGTVGWWTFMSGESGLVPLTLGQQIGLLTYLFAALLIVWGTDHYRKVTKALSDEELLRKLSVEELSHRLKNKLATIQAIIRLRLREYPEAREELIASLDALSATDQLILAAQGQGAFIQDIVSSEVHPYETSQIRIDGPAVFLPPNLALTMSLIIHELTTNAAKYGALSNSEGKVSVLWSFADECLNLEWRESAGPPVSVPVKSGFGTRLFSRAIEQFGGTMDTTFATTGVVCKVAFRLDEAAPGIARDEPGKSAGVFTADFTDSKVRMADHFGS